MLNIPGLIVFQQEEDITSNEQYVSDFFELGQGSMCPTTYKHAHHKSCAFNGCLFCAINTAAVCNAGHY